MGRAANAPLPARGRAASPTGVHGVDGDALDGDIGHHGAEDDRDIHRNGGHAVCRNIRTLYNFEPPASDEEIRAAALQYVRKISGFPKPSAANDAAFRRAVDEVTRASAALLDSLVTTAAPRNRDEEAAKAHARAVRRFSPGATP